jgi:hypothetical protein
MHSPGGLSLATTDAHQRSGTACWPVSRYCSPASSGSSRTRAPTPVAASRAPVPGLRGQRDHNLIHVASGLVLLAASPKRASARAVALGFGLVYGVVAIVGLIDGEDVLGLITIKSADNLLHIALAALGIITGLISRDDDRGRGSTVLGRDSDDRFQRDTAATSRAHEPVTCADSTRTVDMTASGARSRVAEITNAALRGAASGVLGAAAMAADSKVEQLATGRPDSYVPARTPGAPAAAVRSRSRTGGRATWACTTSRVPRPAPCGA